MSILDGVHLALQMCGGYVGSSRYDTVGNKALLNLVAESREKQVSTYPPNFSQEEVRATVVPSFSQSSCSGLVYLAGLGQVGHQVIRNLFSGFEGELSDLGSILT